MALLTTPGVKLTLPTKKNFVFQTISEAADFDFVQISTYELYEKEFARYGNQSIKGF